MIIALPPDAMVLLVGPSGSGKSTFAARHFAPTEVLSSDAMRAIVADDPMDQAATDAAFELLHTALAMRLSLRRLAVVDATNVEGWAREKLLAVARRARRPAHAIVFDLPLEVCLRRNLERDHPRPAAAIRRQHHWLRESLPTLTHEGLDAAWTLATEKDVDAARISRVAPALSSPPAPAPG
ncbi:MAG TPA: AAA family ATPase [Candidatus Limnocylindria bacterium]|nr:AAA family ATPase [Candidatus Limnocylindria bacterium]